MMTRPRLLLAALAVLAFAAPAAAAPSRGELEARINALETRIATLERQVNNDAAASRLLERVDELEAQLMSLNGDLEQARFENGRLRTEIDTLRRQMELRELDIANRLGIPPSDLGLGEAGGDIAPAGDVFDAPPTTREEATGSLGETRTVALSDDPEQALEEAKGLLYAGDFDQAERAFAQFAARFEADPHVSEALFWQGETFFVRGAYPQAMNAYIESLRAAPKGPKAPDAMIKLAAALAATGEAGEACKTLNAFKKDFPKAGAALNTKADRARRDAGCS